MTKAEILKHLPTEGSMSILELLESIGREPTCNAVIDVRCDLCRLAKQGFAERIRTGAKSRNNKPEVRWRRTA